MNMDTTLIKDPQADGPLVLDDRPPGHWYPIEIRVLADRYRLIGAAELSRNWIPEHSPAQIDSKARELGL